MPMDSEPLIPTAKALPTLSTATPKGKRVIGRINGEIMKEKIA